MIDFKDLIHFYKSLDEHGFIQKSDLILLWLFWP